MFSVEHMMSVIVAVLQMQQLSFRFTLDMSGGIGDREAVAAIIALQLQHQSQIGNLYIFFYITREYWILPRSVYVCLHQR